MRLARGRGVDNGSVDSYWNHNTAYHPRILELVRTRRHQDVLDVGAGDGQRALYYRYLLRWSKPEVEVQADDDSRA